MAINQQITALPDAPNRLDRDNFATDMHAFFVGMQAMTVELETFRGEANTTATGVNTDATAAVTARTAAQTAQTAAETAQTAAESASNAQAFSSGESVTAGEDVRWSLIDFKSYRCKASGAHTTDPANDSTNWALLGGAMPAFTDYALVAHTGNNGNTYTQGADRTVYLNEVLVDTGNIVTLDQNRFSLVAGQYLMKWFVPVKIIADFSTHLYDYSGSSILRYGATLIADNGSEYRSHWAVGLHRVVLTEPKTFEIRARAHYNNTSTFGSYSLGGGAVILGQSTYERVEIYKEVA